MYVRYVLEIIIRRYNFIANHPVANAIDFKNVH